MLTCGSLFTGAGGLEMGVQSVLPAVPGVTDVQALRIGGNGVVPQQAAAAARALLHDLATESAA